MKQFILFAALAATASALPMGPDGLDLATLCAAQPGMRLMPICKDLQTELAAEGKGDDDMCTDLCRQGTGGSLCLCENQPPAYSADQKDSGNAKGQLGVIC